MARLGDVGIDGLKVICLLVFIIPVTIVPLRLPGTIVPNNFSTVPTYIFYTIEIYAEII